ncbi:MAG: type II secretion system protein [Deltaproteobacteria bacterium]|nr:MAG: type II secretion system protein [Deltaproteobacteria bacterium]
MKERCQGSSRKERGSTLIELLVASAMLGVLSIMFLNAFGSSVKVFTLDQKRTEAIMIAESKIEEFLGFGYDRVVKMARHGHFPETPEPMKNGAFHWQIELSPPLGETRLRTLRVNVSWQVSGERHETHLVTYISPH